MIETFEDIQASLEVLGAAAVFTAGTIYVIPDVNLLYEDTNGQSSSQVETLEFNFAGSTEDFVTLAIAVGDTFTITDTTYTYTFKVCREQLVFGNGWSRLPVNRISKTTL